MGGLLCVIKLCSLMKRFAWQAFHYTNFWMKQFLFDWNLKEYFIMNSLNICQNLKWVKVSLMFSICQNLFQVCFYSYFENIRTFVSLDTNYYILDTKICDIYFEIQSLNKVIKIPYLICLLNCTCVLLIN